MFLLYFRTAIDERNLHQDKIKVWKLFYGICSALKYLHRNGVIHRDLNPNNILLNSPMSIAKISDFGSATTTVLVSQQLPKAHYITSSTVTGSSQTGSVGVANYTAPELADAAFRSIYGTKVDIYSLGIIFFEMCHQPFKTGMERSKVLEKMRENPVVFPDSFCDSKFSVPKMVRLVGNVRILNEKKNLILYFSTDYTTNAGTQPQRKASCK